MAFCVFDTDALTILYGEKENKKSETALADFEEIIAKTTDSYEIQPLVTQNIYEKVVVIAMRSFPHKRKQEIYEYIVDQLKSI